MGLGRHAAVALIVLITCLVRFIRIQRDGWLVISGLIRYGRIDAGIESLQRIGSSMRENANSDRD
jgi:hypothetical protein